VLVKDHVSEVRRYYEANTSLFASLGQDSGCGLGTIRRAIWGPGVHSRAESFHFVDSLIAEQLLQLRARHAAPLRVFDFGSGNGSSLIRLASSAEFEGIGISLSARQTQNANTRIAAHGLHSRLRCIEGNFLDLPADLPKGQLLFSIEAFAHSVSAAAFFDAAAAQLEPDGVLVICDDFLTDRAAATSALSQREQRVLAEFRHGWLISALAADAELESAAHAAGFKRVSALDLTTYIELQRPRDRLVRGFVALARHLPVRVRSRYYLRMLIGGNALQRGLLDGLIAHRFLVYRRAQHNARATSGSV
jgi:predicted O-methyltransferase YrrM